MSSRNTYRAAPTAGGHHPPQSYYYDDVPDRAYNRRTPVGVADEGDDDDAEPEDDEETAVATDLSLMPPRPTQNSRAGFRSNPISDQVEFDKEAAPATVGPRRPKPKTATFAEPPRQAQTLQVPSRVQREAPRQRQQLQSNRYDESHDDDPESDEEEETVVDEDHYARRRSAPPPRAQPIRQQYAAPPPPRPTASAAYARSSPAPQQRQYQAPQSYYPPHAHQLQHRQAPHGFSSLADEPEDEGLDSDDDAFTAVGTGVATDLSLDDDEAIPMGRGRLGYEQPYAQTQPRRGEAPSGAGGYAAPAPQARRQQQYVAEDEYDDDDPAPPPPPPRQLAPPPTLRRPSSSTALRSTPSPRPTPIPDLPQDSLVEKELIQLLKEMNFSVALKDLHDHLGLGVQKTLVAEDGMGHAYCKVHCKKLPRHDAVEREPHLKNHWIPLAGARWEFRTTSHRVTIVWKTTAVGAYESAGLLGRR